MNQGGGAAPTGCYKCGRTGHWSRDCPSDPSTSETNNNADQHSNLDLNSRPRPPFPAHTDKPKEKQPKGVRPKLTPDLLLSDAGVGHILRYFPPALKCRGRSHEVDDLQHLLRMYSDWHSRLIPYYKFEQFLDKVERVGGLTCQADHTWKTMHGDMLRRAPLRLLMLFQEFVCLRELRDKVAHGVDPTKLQDPQVQHDPVDEQDTTSGLDMPSNLQENNIQLDDDNNLQEDMPQSIWENATEGTSQPVHVEDVRADTSIAEEVPNQTAEANSGNSSKTLMSEEQIARMEANRLKALERAAARSRSS